MQAILQRIPIEIDEFVKYKKTYLCDDIPGVLLFSLSTLFRLSFCIKFLREES